nr:YbiU family protein [Streptomyces olivaceoviridis]
MALRHGPQRRPGGEPEGLGQRHVHPRRPLVPRNERYAALVREAFVTGSSPSDFPEEHDERAWTGRFTLDQLNDTGHRGLGLGLD